VAACLTGEKLEQKVRQVAELYISILYGHVTLLTHTSYTHFARVVRYMWPVTLYYQSEIDLDPISPLEVRDLVETQLGTHHIG
jgi:hypothetical protein